MIKMGMISLKGLEFFSKKEKKRDKTQILIQIINKIEKENPEKAEQLQDIKVDILEQIPLTNEKKVYLKKEIDFLKNARKNQKQETKKQDLKTEYDIPEFESAVNVYAISLDALKQMIKKIDKESNMLFQEIKTATEENKLEQIEKKNTQLQNNLRRVMSNLNTAYSEILDQSGKAKSVQIRMTILDNELNLKKDALK